MNEAKEERRPEMVTLLDFLNEVNQKNEKVTESIFEMCNKLIPMKEYPIAKDELKFNGGALGDLHKLITQANINHDRLCRIYEHLKTIV